MTSLEMVIPSAIEVPFQTLVKLKLTKPNLHLGNQRDKESSSQTIRVFQFKAKVKRERSQSSRMVKMSKQSLKNNPRLQPRRRDGSDVRTGRTLKHQTKMLTNLRLKHLLQLIKKIAQRMPKTVRILDLMKLILMIMNSTLASIKTTSKRTQ